jgi:hypothetical protein
VPTPSLPERWPRIERHAGAVTRAVLERLHALDPRARDAFAAADLPEARRRFVAVADAIVRLLHDPDALAAAALPGRRTSAGTIRGRDCALVGAALLHALDRTLGGEWDAEEGAAHAALYRLLSTAARWSARPRRRAA